MRNIVGTLRAPNGAALSNVQINFTALESSPDGVPTGAVLRINTDSDGHYDFSVLAGRYRIGIGNEGPDRVLAPDVTVVDGGTIDLISLIDDGEA